MNIIMKGQLIIALLFISLIANAQIQFERVISPNTPDNILSFCNVNFSDAAFADIDGDNDQDVLITGVINNGNVVAKLYRNDGAGNFTIISSPNLVGVKKSSVAFADIDGDNDLDLLIIGSDSNDNPLTKLYENDGNGNYSEITGSVFENLSSGSIAFADIDNDGDLDVLLIGKMANHYKTTKLYTNDGNGNYSEILNTSFDSTTGKGVAFADVDNDNDLDLLITGYNNSKIYLNDGSGVFSEMPNSPFTGALMGSSVAFSDIDGDNDIDVAISGSTRNGPVTKLYTNDGNGNFTENTYAAFIGVFESSIAFADVDNDNDMDLIISGCIDRVPLPGTTESSIYLNDGLGNFTQVNSSPFLAIMNGSIAFADVDNDNDQDMLITGSHNFNHKLTKLYINDGTGSFHEVLKYDIDAVRYSSNVFFDADGDNDQDVLVTGKDINNKYITKLYLNDGIGNFDEMLNTPFVGVWASSVAVADIDGDNTLDLLITGADEYMNSVTKLYTNSGTGIFTEKNSPFENVYESSVRFADIDNDNDQDVIIIGVNHHQGSSSYYLVTKLYTNDGLGNFSEVTNTPFEEVYASSVRFADIDNDNDLDLLITGATSPSDYSSKLYVNDGSGNFSEVLSTPFVGVAASSVAFADVDNDNDLDVLISGMIDTSNNISKLYLNDGNGNFTESTASFNNVSYCSVAFADMDGDNDQDILITGSISTDVYSSQIYVNDGLGNFSELANDPIVDVYRSSVEFTDIDNDNDLDLLVIGENICSGLTAILYRNISTPSNVAKTEKNSFTIYPNPTINSIMINTNDKFIQNIQLFNLQGQDMPFTYYKDQHKVEMNLPKGIYLLSLTIDGNKSMQKVIVE